MSTAASYIMTDAELECPICIELMQRPIALNCGHSGCQACLVTWVRTRPVCPVCREEAGPEAVGRLGVNITLQKVRGSAGTAALCETTAHSRRGITGIQPTKRATQTWLLHVLHPHRSPTCNPTSAPAR